MGRLKNPMLGFGARGSIADSLTFQRIHHTDIVRKKPIPSYRRTLPQLYQRWLYEDYAYLWTQQSIATKQTYASAGSRFHLTGFQYWMKHWLTHLPDIAAMYYLDAGETVTAIDRGRNGNDGVIFGASPSTLVIDGALFFDGVNDRVEIPSTPSLNLTSVLSLECWFNFDHIPGAGFWHHFIAKYSPADKNGYILQIEPLGRFQPVIWDAGVARYFYSAVLTPGKNYHVVMNFDGSNMTAYLNTEYVALITGSIGDNIGNPLRLGCMPGLANYYNGILDHIVIRNRTLDATEIQRHYERRYPA